MNQLEESLRLLDPVDPDAPAPDGEAMLREIVRTPVPRHVATPRRRRTRTRVALAGVTAVAAAAGLVLAMPARDGVDVVAAAYKAVSQPDTILHYRVRHSTANPGSSDARPVFEAEVWQAGDGSRVRSLSRSMLPGEGGPGVHPNDVMESVQTKDESRTYIAADNRVIVYDTNVPRLPAPGGVAFADRDLGDPRTLLERARSGDEKVVELGEATVRGIPVLQFRVGECKMTSRKADGGRSITYSFPLVASVSRDDYTPVRIEQDTNCGDAPKAADAPHWDQLPRAVADYVGFETLPATDDNRQLLEMRPHPGARVLDGEDIDAQEEAADRRAARPRPDRP